MSKDARQVLKQLNEEFISCRWDNLIEDFERGAALCESPIEELMLAALMNDIELHDGSMFSMIGTIQELEAHRGPEFFIAPQSQIGRYRVDFAVAWWRPQGGLSRLAVECDGHDFHEKTKEQAQRDKARDRWLMSRGWPVIRFTGSEIYADAEKCAYDVAGALFQIMVDRAHAAWIGRNA